MVVLLSCSSMWRYILIDLSTDVHCIFSSKFFIIYNNNNIHYIYAQKTIDIIDSHTYNKYVYILPVSWVLKFVLSNTSCLNQHMVSVSINLRFLSRPLTFSFSFFFFLQPFSSFFSQENLKTPYLLLSRFIFLLANPDL